jgi:hypothetical protein
LDLSISEIAIWPKIIPIGAHKKLPTSDAIAFPDVVAVLPE